ncbi:MAG: HD-GYP domain-containing protein [Dehalococcoidia bacterium]
MPPQLRLYVGSIAVAFVFTYLGICFALPAGVSAVHAQEAAWVTLLVAAARAFPVRVAPKRLIGLDTAPAFLAVLMLPPAPAMAAVALGMLGGEFWARGRWFQALFSGSVAGLRVGLAALVVVAVAGSSAGAASPLRIVLAVLPAAVTMYLVGALLVDLAAGLTLGHNVFHGWWSTNRHKLPQEGLLLLVGLAVALIAHDATWILPLLLAPAALVRRLLQDGVHVKSDAREALESLADAVDLRHQRAADHSRRVAELCRTIARRMGLSARETNLVVDAARLRDIGEIALPPDLLSRPGPLTEEERAELRQHPVIGARMVARFSDFAACAPLIMHHHERWDGWGAPDGLTGEAIPLGARIIAVADRYEAMIASRPYREALTPARAREELRLCAGTQLDPAIVDVLFDILGHGVDRGVGGTALNRSTATTRAGEASFRVPHSAA